MADSQYYDLYTFTDSGVNQEDHNMLDYVNGQADGIEDELQTTTANNVLPATDFLCTKEILESLEDMWPSLCSSLSGEQETSSLGRVYKCGYLHGAVSAALCTGRSTGVILLILVCDENELDESECSEEQEDAEIRTELRQLRQTITRNRTE